MNTSHCKFFNNIELSGIKQISRYDLLGRAVSVSDNIKELTEFIFKGGGGEMTIAIARFRCQTKNIAGAKLSCLLNCGSSTNIG